MSSSTRTPVTPPYAGLLTGTSQNVKSPRRSLSVDATQANQYRAVADTVEDNSPHSAGSPHPSTLQGAIARPLSQTSPISRAASHAATSPRKEGDEGEPVQSALDKLPALLNDAEPGRHAVRNWATAGWAIAIPCMFLGPVALAPLIGGPAIGAIIKLWKSYSFKKNNEETLKGLETELQVNKSLTPEQTKNIKKTLAYANVGLVGVFGEALKEIFVVPFRVTGHLLSYFAFGRAIVSSLKSITSGVSSAVDAHGYEGAAKNFARAIKQHDKTV